MIKEMNNHLTNEKIRITIETREIITFKNNKMETRKTEIHNNLMLNRIEVITNKIEV